MTWNKWGEEWKNVAPHIGVTNLTFSTLFFVSSCLATFFLLLPVEKTECFFLYKVELVGIRIYADRNHHAQEAQLKYWLVGASRLLFLSIVFCQSGFEKNHFARSHRPKKHCWAHFILSWVKYPSHSACSPAARGWHSSAPTGNDTASYRSKQTGQKQSCKKREEQLGGTFFALSFLCAFKKKNKLEQQQQCLKIGYEKHVPSWEDDLWKSKGNITERN